LLLVVFTHLFIHPFVDDALLKCNVRAHPRIVAPKLVFPSRPRATLCFTVVEPASRALACDLRIFAEMGVYACARVRPMSFCANVFTSPLLLSIPQKLNLGGILRTTYGVL
jgi:hypothetical protein